MGIAVGIVLLHYNDAELTEKCVADFRMQNWDKIDYHFVVVDNASPDGSGKELADFFECDQDVSVLLSTQNGGFSKGNNIGIHFLQSKQKYNLIVVSNNDIKIEDKDFFQKLVKIYEKEQFAVLGPSIFSLAKNFEQSPIRQQLLGTEELPQMVTSFRKKLFLLKLIKPFHVYDLLKKLRNSRGKQGAQKGMDSELPQDNVVVHGSFFVLSEYYLQEFPDGLYDKLFMYMEEDALAYRCHKKKLKIVYRPELKVLHYDGMSAKKSTGSRINKFIFELEHMMESVQELERMMTEG